MNRAGILRVVAIFSGLMPQWSIAASSDSTPSIKPKLYEPYSKTAEALLGTMLLSKTSVSFSEYHRTARLKFSGKAAVPGVIGQRMADMYQITNSSEFSSTGICSKPIRWFGAVHLTDPEMIEILLYTMNDYRNYDPTRPDLCLTATFTPDN